MSNPEALHFCKGPGYCCPDGKGRPIDDALAQVTASLKTLQSECIRVAATLVRIPAEAVIRNRELINRDTTVAIALELKNASDGMRRPALFVGAPGVRDPDHPCDMFSPGKPTNGGCQGDGHHLCGECSLLEKQP